VPSVQKLRVPLHSFSNGMSANRKLMMFRRLVRNEARSCTFLLFLYEFAAWWATIGTDTIPIGGLQSDFTSEKRLTGFLLGRLSARWPRTQISNNVTAAENARYCRGQFTPRKILSSVMGLILFNLEAFRRLPTDCTRRRGRIPVQYKRWERLLKAALSFRESDLDFVIQIARGGPLHDSLERQTRELDWQRQLNSAAI
jgi:hypothetical protein